MSFNKLTLVTLVSTLMFSSVYANQQKEEEEDSVTEWGPWAIPVATAAGPEATINALLFAGAAGSEYVFIDPEFLEPTDLLDRTIPDVIDPDIVDPDIVDPGTLGCQPGAPCGYASYYPITVNYGRERGDSAEGNSQRGFNLRGRVSSLTPQSASFFMEELTIDGGEGNRSGRRTLQYLVTPGGDESDYIDILSLPLKEGRGRGPFNGFVGYDSENRRLDGLVDSSLRCIGNCRGPRAPFARWDHGNLEGLSGEGVSHGFWISSANNVESNYIQSYLGSFVFGTTSTLASLETLKSNLSDIDSFSRLNNQLVAVYSGHTALGAGVNLSINFTESTWGGSFNRGRDGHVKVYSSTNGTSITGHVGFDIKGGTIEGVNLNASSSALSARDGVVSGTVTASFFGPTASEIAGIADIQKTKTPTPQQQVTQSYDSAVHATTFSTNLVTPASGQD